MKTRNATIRLPEDLAQELSNNGSINSAIIDRIDCLKTIQIISLNELKGVFLPAEWKFMADCMNGIMVTDSLRFNKDVLLSNFDDAELYEKKASKWNVDLNSLKKKIMALHAANIDAIYARLEKFYDTNLSKELDIDTWAVF